MKARKLINGSSYGPVTLKVITKAFDDAWSEIAHQFQQSGLQTESARLQLANAILSIAMEDSRDAAALKNAALEMMALKYRERSGST